MAGILLRIRRWFGFGKAEDGSVAVETALILPMFFVLVVGLSEVCLILTAQTLLENAAFRSSRLAKTGYAANGMTQSYTVNQLMIDELQSFGSFIDVTKLVTTATAYNSFSSIGTGGTSGYGLQEQIVVFTVSYPWHVVTPINGLLRLLGGTGFGDANGNINLNARIVVRNEPYG